jgi:hypothetical protein
MRIARKALPPPERGATWAMVDRCAVDRGRMRGASVNESRGQFGGTPETFDRVAPVRYVFLRLSA